MSGIGKTAIAKAVYKIQSVLLFRECLKHCQRMTGIIALQNKVISSILRDDSLVKDAYQGVKIIQDRVCKYKVLILLDE
ncbi:unnamed protein product [Linum tenue]|uniref:Uncharacterized protein n=1 Tax=Linum tenue TaxID=586396 RepID=A0AAV0HHZ9_9ROSI|nr:unnamed protein product [Linum tenue]